MNALSKLTLAALLAATGAITTAAMAQAAAPGNAQGADASASATEMTEGEIKKVDRENKRLTIKHGEIRNLDMPAMTMVFQVKDPAMVERVRAGDKIRFKVEKGSGGFVVTELQPAAK